MWQFRTFLSSGDNSDKEHLYHLRTDPASLPFEQALVDHVFLHPCCTGH